MCVCVCTVRMVVMICIIIVCYYNCSTLTQTDEPYPMLVLCGPNGSGKEYYAQQLVEEFPSFFGLGYI